MAQEESVKHTKWQVALGLAAAAAVAVTLVVLAFLWPTVTSSAKSLPIAISGPTAPVQQLKAQLEKASEGVFELTVVESRDAAVSGIKDRSYYGAIVIGQAPEVLEASAAGPAPLQMMNQLAQNLQQQLSLQAAQAAAAGAPATPTVKLVVTDVVPLASTDARGTGLAAASFPMVLGGMIGGILLSLLLSGVWRRLVGVATYAVLVGFLAAAVLGPWFGIVQGNFLLNVAVIALSAFATAVFIVGATALLGRAGVAVGSVITMLIGNPLSSATQPVQFMAEPWGAIGQWFVPGASTTLLRDASYFPESPTLFSWLVLAGWALLGIVLSMIGHFRNQEVVEVAAFEEAGTDSPVLDGTGSRTSEAPAKHLAL
ncbi:hypothetical protein [Psychromicrobium lacuslunae]|uniref:hypothetical protein n=1 Tax=Psychromicrobium lacuslunae TaxID=1618207 RepID=UPI000695C5ED|nr:hypothetical protein [Psychromicrobium lacuslunae]